MKHSILAKLLIMILCFSLVLCACGKTEDKDTGSKKETTSQNADDTTAKPEAPADPDEEKPDEEKPEEKPDEEKPEEDPDEEKPEEDPDEEKPVVDGAAGQLSASADKTVSAILNGNDGFGVLEQLDTFKVTVDAMGMLENVTYVDLSELSLVDLLTVDMGGEKLEGSVYLQESALAIAIPMLLGEDAYGIALDTLMEDLPNSAIWELAGISYEDFVAELDVDFDAVMGTIMDTLEDTAELEADLQEVMDKIEITAESGKATVYGEEVDADKVIITLTDEDIKAMMDVTIDWMEQTMTDLMAELESFGDVAMEDDVTIEEEFDSMRTEMDAAFENTDLTLTLVANIAPETQYLMSYEMDLAGTIDGEEGCIFMDLVLGVDPVASEKYTLSFGAEAEGEVQGLIEAVIEREITDAASNFDLTISMTEGEETVELLTGSLQIDKADGKYELSMEAEGSALTVSGALKLTDDSFVFSVDSIDVDGEVMELGVSLSIEAIDADEIPEIPEYKNVLKLSADELTQLLELFGMGGEYDEDMEYDEDYEWDEEFEEDWDEELVETYPIDDEFLFDEEIAA